MQIRVFQELRNGPFMFKSLGCISLVRHEQSVLISLISAIFIYDFCLFLVRSVERSVKLNNTIAAEEWKNEGGSGRVA